jgi:hypothetical protein
MDANVKIIKIEMTETLDTMGEATADDLNRWVEFLQDELFTEYPDADVSVNAGRTAKLWVQTSDFNFSAERAKNEIREFKNRCWDRWV